MKKTLMILAMACAVLAGCDKKDSRSDAEILLDNVQGKWVCISDDLYDSRENLENGIIGNTTTFLPDEEYANGYYIEGNQMTICMVINKALRRFDTIKFRSNDGKKIETEVSQSGDGNVTHEIESLQGDRLRITRENDANHSVRVRTLIRTELPLSEQE